MDRLSDGTVVSTRIRLARNLEGYPFPSHLKNEKQAKEIIRLVSCALARLDEFSLYYMDAISGEQAVSLMENHLISPKLIKNKHLSAALINTEESVSIMINEEDHLREQCIVKGLDLRFAYETMSEIDSRIAGSMKFAYDEQFGFLTACPTNLGTGLRASVMQFLPALTINGVMPKLIRSISRLGLTVRGVYGEGSDAEGYKYQISNEVTLGYSEDAILNKVDEKVKYLVEFELRERANLKAEGGLKLKDSVKRAYGVLSNCCRLEAKELISLIAELKLGVALGYFGADPTKDDRIEELDALAASMRPAGLDRLNGAPLSEEEQNELRAEYTAKKIVKMNLIR